MYMYIFAPFYVQCSMYEYIGPRWMSEGIYTLSTEFKWHLPEVTCDQLFKRFKGRGV